MTGHGEAHTTRDGVSVGVEVRTINSRYLKLTVRTSEPYYGLEPRIDAVVRKFVRRGSIQVALRIDCEPTPEDFRLNRTVLASYRQQLESLYDDLHIADSIHPESLLMLPGVVSDQGARSGGLADRDWPLIEPVLKEALENLARMRTDEGRAMAADLRANCASIANNLETVEERSPLVAEGYRDRLTERLNKLLEELDVKVETADVVREVGLFAERSDISEEIVRLKSHLEQFDLMVDDQNGSGRKLDFLTQEMFREANTIGSKANDAAIARQVIDIKASIERMREMIQNVE